jgi:Ni/Co efflux regulator RcnB
MKKLILAALAASILATPVLASPHDNDRGRGRAEQHVVIKKHVTKVQYRSWHKGDRFDRRQAHNYRVIANPRIYKLRPAPHGYRWVRSGNDAVLIGITSGIISSVIVNSIR